MCTPEQAAGISEIIKRWKLLFYVVIFVNCFILFTVYYLLQKFFFVPGGPAAEAKGSVEVPAYITIS